MEIWEVAIKAYEGYWKYLWGAITHPLRFPNGFYFLILLSLLTWGLELLLPWRRQQHPIRKGFWLDAFYMFFNYFIFNLLVFVALTKTTGLLFGKMVSYLGLPSDHLIDLSWMTHAVQYLLYFLIYDFVQWGVHNLLHRNRFLWEFHKVHHSVEEMGFAAHLRYHFMEAVVYQVFKFTLIAYLFNFRLTDAFYIYFFATAIGHLNHANLGWSYGPLRYILNNPKMHIWHHAKDLPESHPKGMNFGITLSVWDYLFGTAYIPEEGRDIPLGFEGIESYPQGFIGQLIRPFKKNK